jgi:hypothetical protein
MRKVLGYVLKSIVVIGIVTILCMAYGIVATGLAFGFIAFLCLLLALADYLIEDKPKQ